MVEGHPVSDGGLIAPEGQLWVCCACGKTSPHKYGGDPATTRGWDASCMLNSVLVPVESCVFDPDTMRVVRVS